MNTQCYGSARDVLDYSRKVGALLLCLLVWTPSRLAADTLSFGFVPPDCPELVTWGYLCNPNWTGSCVGWKCGANPYDSGPFCPSGGASGSGGGAGGGNGPAGSFGGSSSPGGSSRDAYGPAAGELGAPCNSCGGGLDGGPGGGSGGPGGSGSGECCPAGLATWSVHNPHLSLLLRDKPMFYHTSRGGQVGFELHHKGNPGPTGSTNTAQPAIFGLGKNWETPWRSYIYELTAPADSVYLFLGDGSARIYYKDRFDYVSATYLATTNGGYSLTFPDGSTNIYNSWVTMNGHQYCFLSKKVDVLGNEMSFSYTYTTDGAGGTNSIRLDQVTDLDGKVTTFGYVTNLNYLNLISEVRGPYGLTNRLAYNSDGFLTNITDAIGLTSGLTYDSSNRVSRLITPYGTTRFHYYASNSWNALRVEELGLRNHLYLAGYDPTVNVWPTAESEGTTLAAYLANWFSERLQTNDFGSRNTFYWGPLQYQNLPSAIRTALTNEPATFNPANLTTNDYQLGWSTHWLRAYTENTNVFLTGISHTVERAPSERADGATQGAMTWYDYAQKEMHGRGFEGELRLPQTIATRTASGDWHVRHFARNLGTGKVILFTENWTEIGLHPTNPIDTYATAWRTELFTYGPMPFHSTLVEHVHNGEWTNRNVINSYGLVETNENALGEITLYEYDARRLFKVKRPSDWVTEYAYDSNEFLQSVTDTDGSTAYRTNSFTYTNGMVLTHTDERGRSVTNAYDLLWRLVSAKDSRGTVAYAYSNLDLARVTDRLGYANSYVYNGFRDLIYHTNATGTNFTAYSYCDCGSLNSVTDPGGHTTSYTYDNAGRRLRTTFPGGGWIENTYATGGEVIRVTDSAGVASTNWYTVNGLLYSATNAFGRVFLNAFDDENRVIRSVDQNGVQHTMAYDDLGRLLWRSRQSSNECSQLYIAWLDRFDYTDNVAGPVASYTEYVNVFTTECEIDWDIAYRETVSDRIVFDYDFLGRKTNEVHFDTNNVPVMTNAFAYNLAGDLTQLRDGNGQKTTWRYDHHGQATNKLDDADAEMFRYAYDASGHLTSRWSPGKGTTSYTYDPVGNLTFVNYPASQDVTLAYNANNRLTSMSDGIGTTTYSYTPFGAILSEDGPWADDTVSYSYTTNRLRAGLTLGQPAGSSWAVSYGYDSISRLTNVNSPAGAFGYQYHPGLKVNAYSNSAPSPASLVQQLSLPGGVTINNDFDEAGRWLETTARNITGTNLNQHLYEYNGLDQRIKQTRIEGDYLDYAYDALGQLVKATGVESGGTINRSHEQFGYAYDAAGNLNWRTNNTLVQTFTVNSLNQLSNATRSGNLTVAGVTHGPATSVTVKTNGGTGLAAERYADNTFSRTNLALTNGNNIFTAVATDSSGRTDTNVITVYLPATTSFQYDTNGDLIFDGQRGLAYDDENQLTRVTVTNSWKSEFDYDGKMRRRIRREYEWRNSAWVLAAEVRYVYDGNLVIQERDQLNRPKVTYTRGKDLSGSLEGAGGIGGLLARTEQELDAKAHVYYSADGNGNVTCLVDTNQAVVGRYVYDPFGNTLAATGPAAEANLYRFSSKELHVASGLIYYLYRFYDPNLQRWPNRDPIGERGGIDLYAFVRNRPGHSVDAFGLSPFCDKLNDKMNKLSEEAMMADFMGDYATFTELANKLFRFAKLWEKFCDNDQYPPSPPVVVPVWCPVQGRRVPQDPYPATNQDFCDQHPVLCKWGLPIAGVVIILGTIAEDVITAGAGTADDVPTIGLGLGLLGL